MRVVVAGGGTGGHLYPGIAIAEEVVARGGQVLFVGTSRGIEARAVPAAGYPLELLEVSGLKRMGLVGTVRGLGRLPKAILRARRILRAFRPDVVVGVGGYASGPVGIAAVLTGVPLFLQEQNSVPGFTNRTLARFARRVFAAFPEAEAAFPRGKVELLGNPVRRRFLEAVRAEPLTLTPSRLARGEGTGGEPSLLVVGGSQGAKAVNELVAGAMEQLARKGAAPRLVHQSGTAEEAALRARYEAAGLGERVTVRPFIDDMVSAYRQADLVIGRAGALTLAELAVLGRPSILIPLPTAADDHQTKNARSFADAGAAELFPQTGATPEALAERVGTLLGDAPRLGAMAAAARSLGKPDAAGHIVDRFAELLTG